MDDFVRSVTEGFLGDYLGGGAIMPKNDGITTAQRAWEDAAPTVGEWADRVLGRISPTIENGGGALVQPRDDLVRTFLSNEQGALIFVERSEPDFDTLKLQYRRERERYADCVNHPLTDKQRMAWAKERNDRQAIANAFKLPAPHDQTDGGQAGLRSRI